MWFHKKKISGSGLSKEYYFKNAHLIKVFHANDITSCTKKVEVLKKLNMWYLHNNKQENINLLQPHPLSVDGPFFNFDSSKQHVFNKTGKFYIYPWPKEVSNITNLAHPWRRLNFGAGPLLDEESGQFNTYMHSLFTIVFHRLLLHPRRTRVASEAEWIFIPYDITSDAYHNSNKALATVLRLLKESSIFTGSQGLDHFFIDSSEPFWYEKKTAVSAFYNLCRVCTKFTPSTLPVPYQKWQREFIIDDTYVHIPYTSTWHYYEDIRHSDKKWAWEFDIHEERPNLIAFVGIIKKMVPSATHLRRLLVQQCKAANANERSSIGKVTDRKICNLNVLGKNSWQNFGSEASLYRNSTFCLLPTGDIPSRKAIFDMLLAGCIPVVFDARQINIYKWHLTDAEMKGIHYFVDMNDVVTSELNVPDILMKITDSLILAMRSMIKQVAWKLQYALPPETEKNENVTLKQWIPPKIDALEIILNKLMTGVV